MRDFAIHLSHRPGEVSRVASALGKVGVNIKSIAAMTVGSQGILRLIADDVEAARTALREAHFQFEESEVVTVLLENRAGELADMADKLANANINLQAVYLTGIAGDMVELAVIADDAKKAKKLLE